MLETIEQEDVDTIEYCTKRLSALRADRSTWEPDWKDLNAHFYTRACRWQASATPNKGGRRNKNLIDNTGVFARTTLEAGMQSGLTNPARPWFRTTTPDIEMMENTEVSTWLYAVDQKLREVLLKSNFYSVMQQQYGTWATYGTIAMLVVEDKETVVQFVPDDIGCYFLAVNDKGVVDTRYKEWMLSTKQMAEKFCSVDGKVDPDLVKKRLSMGAQQAYERKDYDQFFAVIHVLEPDMERAGYWKSLWYEPSEKRFASKAEFDYNPLIAARWRLDESSDVYGTPAALTCLGAVKSLQIQQKRKAQAIDKHVDPPLVGHGDLKTSQVSTLPGTITYAPFTAQGGNPQLMPLYTVKPEIQALLLDIEDSRAQAKEAMFTNVFLMLTGDNRAQPPTAEEIRAREGERMLMLGPVIQNGDNEIFQPIIDLVFKALVKKSEPYWRGVLDGVPPLPPPPDELQATDLKVDLISVLAQAQRAVALQGIERLGMFVGQLAVAQVNGQGAEAMDKFDIDQAIDEYGAALGTPPTLVRSDAAVAEIRQQRAQAQQQAQQAAQAEQQAKAMQAGSAAVKNMATAPMGEGTALDALAGQAA